MPAPRLPEAWQEAPPSAWKYRAFLPVEERAPIVTLHEGGTPLVACPRLADWCGVAELWVKVEGANPTGSFKDRGMTCAVSWAVAHGAEVLGCASTGNTAASLAAYAARAGVKAVVLVPQGKVALGKLAQSVAAGARVLEVQGNFDDAMRAVRGLADAGDLALLNSVNPFRLEGQKTLAFEVIDQLGWRAPDRLVYPVGNAGNISAGHKALREFQQAGLLDRMPMLTGVQAAGSAPVARAIREGGDVQPWPQPETFATAIRIGAPVSAPKALAAIRDTKGTAIAMPDDAIREAQAAMAQQEGLLVEPASAAPLAGLRALVQAGEVARSERVVCVATGHGLKDPDAAKALGAKPRVVAASVEAMREAMR